MALEAMLNQPETSLLELTKNMNVCTYVGMYLDWNNTTDYVALTDIGRDKNKLKSNEKLLFFGSGRAPRSC